MIGKPQSAYRLSASLNSLEDAFLVLDPESFRRAAEALGVRPSVISRRIRTFEDRIGVSLFQRQNHGFEPTLAGRRILSRGRIILADVESLIQTATLRGSGTEGQLCIGVVASFAGGTALELLRVFLADYPHVELHVVEGSPSDHLSRTRALQMDAILNIGSAPIPGFDVQWLLSEPSHFALPRSHAAASLESVQWEQLADERFIVSKMDPGPVIQDFVVQHLAKLGRRPMIEPRCVSREGLFALVGFGVGISLVGSAEAEVVYPQVVFRPLAHEMLPFSLFGCQTMTIPPSYRSALALTRV